MKLKSWIVAHAGRLVGTADQPSPHDLAHAIEAAGRELDLTQMQIVLTWRGHPLHVNCWPGAGQWEIELRYKLSGQPLAHLYFRDDEQFGASGENPFYAEHDPRWDRGWLALLDEAEVAE